MGGVDFPDMRLKWILTLLLITVCMPALAETTDSARTASPAFKKAERDARRMLNWWKYKLKKDPNLQAPVAPIPIEVHGPGPLLQYSVEEVPLPTPAPRKK